MDDYIERGRIIKFLLPMADASAKLHDGIMTAVFQIRSFPAADVRPERYAKWSRVSFDDLDEGRYICSECKEEQFMLDEYGLHKYCPNCGAKMIGGKADDKRRT